MSRWVKDLIDPNARETALLELSKQREKFPELAPYLWNSFGTMAVLLQVLSSTYSRPTMVACVDVTCCVFAGDHTDIPTAAASGAQYPDVQSCVQCVGSVPVCRIPLRDPRALPASSHTIVSVPVPQYHIQNSPFRVSQTHSVGSYRRSGEAG